MRSRRVAFLAFGLAAAGVLCAFQMPFREYAGQEYNDFPLPADYRDKTEFVFARLMYPQGNVGDLRMALSFRLA